MAGRELGALALAGLLLLPLGAAHGDDLTRVYDPLTHPVAGWLTSDARIALDAPADGFLALPAAQLGGPGAPVTWALPVPITASLLGGIAGHLLLRADGPILAHQPDNALLQVATALDGAAVNGTEQVVTSASAALQPGTVYEFDVVTSSARVATKPGDTLGLLVAFLGLAPSGNVGLVLGSAGSRAAFTLRAPDPAALGEAAPPGWTAMTVDDFAPLEVTTEPVLDIHIHHGDPDPSQHFAKVGTSITLRVVDAESPEQGVSHGPWGIDSPHVLRLSGLGLDETLRVGPSEVLLRPLRLAPVGKLTVSCEQQCNRTGPFATLVVAAPQDEAGQAGGTSQRIDPGKFAEVNLQLAANESFSWSFRTEPATPIHWDIHAHPGDQVITYAQGDDAQRSGNFSAPSAGIYSLLLENSNPDAVTVTYSVQGGTPYAPPRSPLPFEGWLLLPALLGAALALRRR
ncbi:MAG: hypothetical protein LC624_09735 [Halobacteriales archaeon]|nr:hypothetical protein [Halobacteriales archaeon]